MYSACENPWVLRQLQTLVQTAFRKWVQALKAKMWFFFYILGILKPSLSSDDLTWDSITFPSHKLVRRWPSVAPSSVLTVPGLENLFRMAKRRNSLENTPATNSETSGWFNVGIRKNQLTICNPMVWGVLCVGPFPAFLTKQTCIACMVTLHWSNLRYWGKHCQEWRMMWFMFQCFPETYISNHEHTKRVIRICTSIPFLRWRHLAVRLKASQVDEIDLIAAAMGWVRWIHRWIDTVENDS